MLVRLRSKNENFCSKFVRPWLLRCALLCISFLSARGNLFIRDFVGRGLAPAAIIKTSVIHVITEVLLMQIFCLF